MQVSAKRESLDKAIANADVHGTDRGKECVGLPTTDDERIDKRPAPSEGKQTHTHTRTHARTHTHAHARTHARTHTRTHTHTHTHARTHTHTHTHMHTHTHTHTHTSNEFYVLLWISLHWTPMSPTFFFFAVDTIAFKTPTHQCWKEHGLSTNAGRSAQPVRRSNVNVSAKFLLQLCHIQTSRFKWISKRSGELAVCCKIYVSWLPWQSRGLFCSD